MGGASVVTRLWRESGEVLWSQEIISDVIWTRVLIINDGSRAGTIVQGVWVDSEVAVAGAYAAYRSDG